MRKPNGFDAASDVIGFKNISLGGHRCVIHEVTEERTTTGKEYLKVAFDTTFDDRDPEFYAKKYKSDTRQDKKWQGIMTIFVLDPDGFTSSQFKGFCTSLTKSNTGYTIPWDSPDTLTSMKGKKVGLVFREEEYAKTDGTIGVAVKPCWACEFEKAVEQDVPARKVKKQNTGNANTQTFAPKFEEIKGDLDLPF